MNRKQVKRNRPRCNMVGCMSWAYKGDCRCLKHILMKYNSVWSHATGGTHDETGHRTMPATLDRYEQ